MIYHGTFHDTNYMSYDMFAEMEAFTSLDDAKGTLRDRYRNNGIYTCAVRPVSFDAEGKDTLGSLRYDLFPCVTESAYLDLYIPGQYDAIAKRVSIGPRGGIRVDNG